MSSSWFLVHRNDIINNDAENRKCQTNITTMIRDHVNVNLIIFANQRWFGWNIFLLRKDGPNWREF